MLFGLRDQRGVSAIPLRRYRDYVRSISADSGTPTIQATQATASPLLDLAAVRYVVTATQAAAAARRPEKLDPKNPPGADPGNRLVYRDERVLIYENQEALGRVRIVHRSTSVSGAEALDRLRAAVVGRHAGDGILADTALLEPDSDGNAPPELSGSAAPEESVRIADESDPDRLSLAVELVAPGLVVIADTYHPGWQATVDGRPAPIFPADVLFRAVEVGAGAHAIELSYEPRWFGYGVIAFGIACLLVGILLFRRPAASPRVAPLRGRP
jgi:hypothetical protein